MRICLVEGKAVLVGLMMAGAWSCGSGAAADVVPDVESLDSASEEAAEEVAADEVEAEEVADTTFDLGPELTAESSVPKTPATPTDLVESWREILGSIGAKLGAGTASLMNDSVPRELKGDTLVIDFPASGRMQKQLCESNGRAEQIASVLSEHLGRSIRIKFAMIAEPQNSTEANGHAKPIGQKRQEILNDPGVKTVLLGLDATITGIEED